MVNRQKCKLRSFFLEKAKKSFPQKGSLQLSQRKFSKNLLLLLKTFDWKPVKTTALFHPFETEPDLSSLQKNFSNMKWVYPSIDKGGSYSFVYKEKSSAFKKSKGFLQLTSGKKCPIRHIHVFLVPGVAFDRNLNRLGRGRGFYDKVLSQSEESIKIGVSWSCQISPDLLPCDEWDIPMDILLTEKWMVYSKNFFKKNAVKKNDEKVFRK